jgi:hypothetical protein
VDASGSCSMEGYGTSSVEPLGSIERIVLLDFIRRLVSLKLRN